MGGDKQKRLRPEKLIIKPAPVDGISCGSVELELTDENTRLIKIGDIMQLNYKLGNEAIGDDVLGAMDDKQLTQKLCDLQAQRQSRLN